MTFDSGRSGPPLDLDSFSGCESIDPDAPVDAGTPDRNAFVLQHLERAKQIALGCFSTAPRHLCSEDVLRDMESACCLALVEAADAYDPTRGVPFWGFAYQRVSGAAMEVLRKGLMGANAWRRGRMVVLPVSRLETSDAHLFNETPDPSGDVFELAASREQKRFLSEARATLPPEWDRILEQRLAGKTLREIAQGEGLSESRMHQICEQIYARIKGVINRRA